MLTVVKLEDIAGEPKLKLELPPLRLGDPVSLPCFKLRRKTAEGRFEVLEVDGNHCRFRVTAVGTDASHVPHRQLLTVECAQGGVPTWKAIKKPAENRKRLSPAVSPRKAI